MLCGLPLGFAVILLGAFAPYSADAAMRERFDAFSVAPFAELQPGFTTSARQTFALDLGGLGREPVSIDSIELNAQDVPNQLWSTELDKLTIRLDRDLRVGLNRFTIRYHHRVDPRHEAADNPVVHTFYVNHQREVAPVEFGKRGELIVSGVQRFIRAGYRSGRRDRFVDALPSAVEAGFDMVHDYRFESYDIARFGLSRFIKEARVYLRRAEELKLGVFLGFPRDAARNYDEESLATIVAELANERALWMWYIYDEPTEATLSVLSASRIYSLLRHLDPTRPAVMLTHRISTMLQYYPFCDILWYDRYPMIATSEALTSLSPIAAALQKSAQTVSPRKPIWPVLQVHDNKGAPSLRKRALYLPKPSDRNHRPNESELRAQSHLAIAQNSMALAYYWAPEAWYSMDTDTPGVWRSLSRVLRELKALEPVLLSQDSTPAISVSGGHDKVMLWSRKYQDQVYVGVVNAAIHTPAIIRLRLPYSGGEVRQVHGDGRMEAMRDHVTVWLGSAGVIVLAFSHS